MLAAHRQNRRNIAISFDHHSRFGAPLFLERSFCTSGTTEQLDSIPTGHLLGLEALAAESPSAGCRYFDCWFTTSAFQQLVSSGLLIARRRNRPHAS